MSFGWSSPPPPPPLSPLRIDILPFIYLFAFLLGIAVLARFSKADDSPSWRYSKENSPPFARKTFYKTDSALAEEVKRLKSVNVSLEGQLSQLNEQLCLLRQEKEGHQGEAKRLKTQLSSLNGSPSAKRSQSKPLEPKNGALEAAFLKLKSLSSEKKKELEGLEGEYKKFFDEIDQEMQGQSGEGPPLSPTSSLPPFKDVSILNEKIEKVEKENAFLKKEVKKLEKNSLKPENFEKFQSSLKMLIAKKRQSLFDLKLESEEEEEEGEKPKKSKKSKKQSENFKSFPAMQRAPEPPKNQWMSLFK